MILVGELVNASRKSVAKAIEAGDVAAIQRLAQDQAQAGADYIDVNAGIFIEGEAAYLKWLVKTIQEVVEIPCCIDSPNPLAIEAALSVHQGTAMINSISLERDRYEAMIPLVAGTDFKVVALCMSDEGMPKTVDQKLDIAERLINGLVKVGVELSNIYVDPLVQPISTDLICGREFLKAVEKIMENWPGVHTLCGLSNISYGLPERKFLNQAYMVMAIAKGLDGAIVNPLDQRMMASIIAAETLVGRDDFCMNFLKAYREKKFEI